MAKQYYFVSDLHFGGDGELQSCDFADEFIAFLKTLAQQGKDTELIIAGDTFGFWELTSSHGPAQLGEIITHHQAIFDQLKETGEHIRITMMAGNHDYDLACDPAFGEKLRQYNIELDPEVSLVREVGGKKIWVEHGQQVDVFNASPDYGNPHALPSGYFITETVVGGASRASAFGKGNWLKDIRSVSIMQIPDWLFSNYFYREMSGVLRWVATPILLLFGITFLALIAEILRRVGVFDANVLLDNPVVRSLGIVGNYLAFIISVNMLVLLFVLIAAVPTIFLYRDLRKTLQRFQLLAQDEAPYDVNTLEPYLARADTVFRDHPEAAVYIFGHTHEAFLHKQDNRAIINTGTWLKILQRVRPLARFMPSVYYPTFRLNYFHISKEPGRLLIRYVEIPKTPEPELGWLQRAMTWRRKPAAPEAIPAETVLELEGGP